MEKVTWRQKSQPQAEKLPSVHFVTYLAGSQQTAAPQFIELVIIYRGS